MEKTFAERFASQVREELERGANPADIAGMLTGMALAILDEEIGIEDALVRGAKALRQRLAPPG
jgi:hypothetical protein